MGEEILLFNTSTDTSTSTEGNVIWVFNTSTNTEGGLSYQEDILPNQALRTLAPSFGGFELIRRKHWFEF